MKKDEILGLSQEFEARFPLAKYLAEETEKFYKYLFQTSELDARPLKNVRYIGDLSLHTIDNMAGIVLPRLYFNKVDEKANPAFYLITTPDDKVLYAGTSVRNATDKWIPCISVSATTGGVFPPTDSKEAYSLYLALLSAVKLYCRCKVYEICTGYEKIDIWDQYGDCITNPVKYVAAHEIQKHISYDNDYVINICLNSYGNLDQQRRNDDIWKLVSAFKLMSSKSHIYKKFNEEKDITLDDEKQIITLIPIAGGLKISFSKKVKFENDYSPLSDKFVASHVEQASKLMNDEKFWKNVETSVNTLNPSKVMAYFNEQYKEYPVPGEDTRVPIIREATSTKQNEFEKKIKKPSFGNVSFRYVNIPGSKGSRVLFDGGNSYIEIYGECANPTLFEMQEILEAVTTAFGIDDGETRISTEVVESALGNE